jgi:hypothetical protein
MAYQQLRPAPADTTLLINGQRYRLLVTARADSSHKLSYIPVGQAGTALAADSIKSGPTEERAGVDLKLAFTLLDARGKRLFRRELRKKDFNKEVDPDILVRSEPEQPVFLGYNPALGGFGFQLTFVIPESDVGSYMFLLLGLDGQVLELSRSNELAVDAADCKPRFAPNGQVALTCAKLLRPGRPPLTLLKPKSNLVSAAFLSDTTLLTVYAYGEYRKEYGPDSSLQSTQFVEPPKMRAAPNAFILNLRGQPLTRFRYEGYNTELGYSVPYSYAPQNYTYYLLDENRGLRLINKHNPALTREVRFQQMTRFKPPQKPREVRFQIQGMEDKLEFYADQDHPEQLRYRKVAVQ